MALEIQVLDQAQKCGRVNPDNYNEIPTLSL
jgi:hypothetical protein